jgi:hypothetical protein
MTGPGYTGGTAPSSPEYPFGQFAQRTDAIIDHFRTGQELLANMPHHQRELGGATLGGVLGELAEISALPPTAITPDIRARRSELRVTAVGVVKELGLGDEILRLAGELPVDRKADSATMGRAVRENRLAQGLTQAALGEKLDLSRFRVNELERGRRHTVGNDLAAVIDREVGVEVPMSLRIKFPGPPSST